jgi:hypothetical protein
MNRNFFKSLRLIPATFLVGFLLILTVFGQTDPNPNSPTPILLTAPDSTRALAVKDTRKSLFAGIPAANANAFDLYSRVVLYVTNVELMMGEGASAFRVYAEDAPSPIINSTFVT